MLRDFLDRFRFDYDFVSVYSSATTLAEHDVLRKESAARPGQVVQIGYMRRYDEGFLEAHRLVQPFARQGRRVGVDR